MKAPSRSRDEKYCRFHRDHGHDSEQCIQLKDEIEVLIRRGYLKKYKREPPTQLPPDRLPQPTEKVVNNQQTAGVINMITRRLDRGATSDKESTKQLQLHDVITPLEDDV